MSENEVLSIIANLIYQKMIKGKIFYSQELKALSLSKDEPFPSLI